MTFRRASLSAFICLAASLSKAAEETPRADAPGPGRTDAPAPARAVRSYDEIIALPDDKFDLAEAVLTLASEVNPATDVAGILNELDSLAVKVRTFVPETPDGIDYLDALYEVVLDRKSAEPFREDRAENFDLSLAIRKRRGSCLSVGIVTLAVARRVGAPINGVQCPGHFFLRYTPPKNAGPKDSALNMDVTRLTPENWKKLDDTFYRRWHHLDSQAEASGAYLRPLTDREVVSAYLSSRAGYYGQKKDFEQALKDAQRALALNPRNVNALINAGFALESMKRFEDAEKQYDRALEADPRSVRAMNNFASLKVRDSKSSVYSPKQAEKLIETALKIEPDRAFLLATCGEVRAARLDWRDAARCMQQALNLDKKNTAYRDRFMQYRERLREQEAGGKPGFDLKRMAD